jgi:hypothetical protein
MGSYTPPLPGVNALSYLPPTSTAFHHPRIYFNQGSHLLEHRLFRQAQRVLRFAVTSFPYTDTSFSYHASPTWQPRHNFLLQYPWEQTTYVTEIIPTCTRWVPTTKRPRRTSNNTYPLLHQRCGQRDNDDKACRISHAHREGPKDCALQWLSEMGVGLCSQPLGIYDHRGNHELQCYFLN